MFSSCRLNPAIMPHEAEEHIWPQFWLETVLAAAENILAVIAAAFVRTNSLEVHLTFT